MLVSQVTTGRFSFGSSESYGPVLEFVQRVLDRFTSAFETMSQAWVRKQATIARHLSYGESVHSEYDAFDDHFVESHSRSFGATSGTNGSLQTPPFTGNMNGFRNIFYEKSNTLLVFFPVGLFAGFMGWPDQWVFWLNFAGMIPLARLLGVATEELAMGLQNETLGGLLNATFGNAVEVIIVIMALKSGQTQLVKYSLLGSMFSNMLLVLGMSFFLGGLGHRGKELFFQETGAMVNISLLMLACVSVTVPTVFLSGAETAGELHHLKELDLDVSLWCSFVIIVCYACYLWFQLYTHIEMFTDDDSEEEPQISVGASILMLIVITVIISISSEYVVDSVQGLCKESGLNPNFVGMILIPIIGNACEHASAVQMSIMGRPVVSVGIAVGSSVQIALLVVPFAVIWGQWVTGVPMDLAFPMVSVPILILSVLLVFSIIMNGRTNWLEGILLMGSYLIIAVMYWFLPPGLDDGAYAAVEHRHGPHTKLFDAAHADALYV